MIHRIETNIALGYGRPERLNLAQRTLVTGVNGRGKTRIIHALTLALTGTVTDYLGKARAVKAVKDIVELMPAEASELYARAYPRDHDGEGAPAEYRVTRRGESSYSRAHHHALDTQNTEWILPVQTTAAMLALSPEAARTKLLGYILPACSSEELHGEIPSRFHDAPEAYPLNGLRDLQYAAADAPAKLREARADLKTAVSALDTYGQSVGAPVLDVDLRKIEAKGDAAAAGLRAAIQREEALRPVTLPSGGSDLKRAVKEAHGVERKARKKLNRAVAALNAWDAEQRASAGSAKHQRRAAVVALIARGAQLREEAAKLDMRFCPLTGLPWDDPVYREGLKRLSVVQAKVEASLVAHQDTVNERERLVQQRARAAHKAAEATRARETAEAALRVYEGAVSAATAARAEREAANAEDGLLSVAEAEEELERVRDEYTHAAQARAAWKALNAARDRVASCEVREAWWSEYAKALAAAVQALVERYISEFVEEVQTYMPRDTRAHISLGSGTRGLFRLGYSDAEDSTPRYALSGAQLTLCQFALACALFARVRNPPAHPVFIVPAERWFDPDTLSGLMEAMARPENTHQVVLINGTPGYSEGWTHIDLDALYRDTEEAL